MPIQFIPSGILEKINFDRRLEGAGPSAPPKPDGTMFHSRGCKGLQPSKSITALEGVRSLGAAEPDGDNVPPSRLRETATLQVIDGNQSFGQEPRNRLAFQKASQGNLFTRALKCA